MDEAIRKFGLHRFWRLFALPRPGMRKRQTVNVIPFGDISFAPDDAPVTLRNLT
jgi:hypothetical protein